MNFTTAASTSTYGVAYTGVADENNELINVRLKNSLREETIAIGEGSELRPSPPDQITLTAVASGLVVGTEYNCYQYKSYTVVPTKNFAADWRAKMKDGSEPGYVKKWAFTATKATHNMVVTGDSNDKVIFRCVISPIQKPSYVKLFHQSYDYVTSFFMPSRSPLRGTSEE